MSDANVVLTASGVLVAELSSNGESQIELALTDVNKLPLSGKTVQLKLEGSGVKLSTNQLTTNSNGLASFKITGTSAVVGTKGTISATYVDSNGDTKTATVAYNIVDIANLQSAFKLEGCFEKGVNCVSSAALTVSGAESIATAKFTLKDSKGNAVAGKKVNFRLLATGSGSLLDQEGTTASDGTVSARVQAATTAATNVLIATASDANGVETSTTLKFDTIVGNQVSLVSAKSDLISGGDSVDLTALVISAAGTVTSGVPVKFSLVNPTEKGVTLKQTDLTTNDEGKAKATLSLSAVQGADFSEHIIKVKSYIGTGSDYREDIVDLKVTGTSIELSTPNSNVKTDAEPAVTAILKNGKGQAISSQNITFTSSDMIDTTTGLPLNKTVQTGSDGKVLLNTLKVKTGNSTAKIVATGLNVNSSLSFDVSARNFELMFVKNGSPVTEIDIREGGTIELVFKDDTGATLPDSIPVTVTTTLGKILPPTVLTKVAGSPNIRKATIRLTSSFPGTATVRAAFIDSATNNQVVATGTVALVSKIADKLAVQAVTPILAPGAETNI
ncbi:MAG: hypothetical protein KDI39_12220, partial [Pseudomonadales bacterium]|nr:hypothetical protein [Pseudomonadales bacterium]